MIFTNARLIFPDGIRDGFELVSEEGKITAIREQTRAAGKDVDDSPRGSSPSRAGRPRRSAAAGSVVDLGGNYLAPGFVDLHVHGAVGRDTMEASGEAFRAICGFHASGGTTSLLLTTATAPLNAILDVLNAVRACSPPHALATATGLRSRPTIRQICGVHVEGPFISKGRCGAQRAEFIRNPSDAAVEPLLEHADVIKRITIAPELPGALEAIEHFHKHGISVSGGHSDAWDEEARAAFALGLRSVTHVFNCMSSARRRGVYRVAGLLECALSKPEILCELIADGHHVSATLMKMLYRAKGAAGICLVTDATAGAGLPDGSRFSLFGNDCIVEGGVCLLADRSALAGSASRMIDLVRALVDDVEVPLHEAIAMATRNAARAIGLKTKGELTIGKDADLIVLSPDLEVQRTFAASEEIFSLDRQ